MTRQKLLEAATDLIRRKGYVATSVDDICAHAGVTKGAFFHHFQSKEQLAEACLREWDRMAKEMVEAAPFHAIRDPRRRVLGYMEFFQDLFEDPTVQKSCLAGTAAQEISDTNPALRDACNVCFQNAENHLRALLDHACRGSRRRVDTASLASLWMAAFQGSLILYKASRDPSVIRRNLEHAKQYIAGHLPARQKTLATKKE